MNSGAKPQVGDTVSELVAIHRAMTRFRFLHAADIHLDTPMTGVGGDLSRRAESAPVMDILRDASLNAWDNLINLAVEQDVDFVVLAGDIYDGAERGVRAARRFVKGVEVLDQHGVQTFVVHGNHDPVEGSTLGSSSLPASVKVFEPGEPQIAEVRRGDELLAVVHGVSFRTRKEERNLARTFSRSQQHCFQLGLLHANVGGNLAHDNYSPCTVDDLATANLDYWALGHIHSRDVHHESWGWWAYPGNLQGRSRKPSERGSKGALLVEVDGTQLVGEPRFIPCDVVRFAEPAVDVSECDDLVAVGDELVAACESLRSGADGRSLVVRPRLVGTTDLVEQIETAIESGELVSTINSETGLSTPFVWVERLISVVRPPIDLDAVRQRHDVVGSIAQRLDLLTQNPDWYQAARRELIATMSSDLRGVLVADDVDSEDVRQRIESAIVARLAGGG